jgi:hypothetical protein
MIDLSTSTDDGDMVDESITYVKTIVNKKKKKGKGYPQKVEKTKNSTKEMI